MSVISIRQIQGDGLYSPYADHEVITSGVVTAVVRRGFFLQTPDVEWDGQRSDAVFVYSPDWAATPGVEMEVKGEVVDYLKHDTAKPVTQIRLEQNHIRRAPGPDIMPITITGSSLPADNAELAKLLNSLEGMLLKIPAGQTFIAPSNRYGDYVLAMDHEQMDDSVLRTELGGAILAHDNPSRWFPGFRITNYNHAPRLNVGAKLLSDVVGTLNYRVDSYQLAVSSPIKVDPSYVSLDKSTLTPQPGAVTIMTLNCFNLDSHVESENRVLNPEQDVDDDWGDGRFHTLAQAVVLQANVPDIVALQEIQDNDGAEITEVVSAADTYSLLIRTIEQLSGVHYQWADIDPGLGADGGQPGGNIRNGFLYNPQRIELLPDSIRRLGDDQPCFEDSRKPLVAVFRELHSGRELACINVHLASKRHQSSIFAPQDPDVDTKFEVRVNQAGVIREELLRLRADGTEYYVTGDFNDTEHSETLHAVLGRESANLVETLPEVERYDYNHRGKLQVLMHGVVTHEVVAEGRADYEIIHGNELLGVTPGAESDKPSDHAYVIARIRLGS